MVQTTFSSLLDARARRGRSNAEPPLTRVELAALLGVSRAQLYNYMRGIQSPPEWRVRRVAKGLGVSVETLQRALRTSQLTA